jgi:putative intracellular protease/amidase
MKTLILITSILLLSISALAQKSVLMMVPDDFMWPEYAIPRAAYEKAGFKIVVAGKWKNELKPDLRNTKDYPESKPIQPDLTFDEVDMKSFDAISFVAGNGAWHDFFPNPKVHELLKVALTQKKIVGLVCASTGLLGIAGNFDGNGTPLAKGKRVVGYYKVEGLLRSLGKVRFVEGGQNDVTAVRDGNLITGRNPQSSQAFADEIVKALSN